MVGVYTRAPDLTDRASGRGFALCDARAFFVATVVGGADADAGDSTVVPGAGGRRGPERRVRGISSGDAGPLALENLPAQLLVGLVLRNPVSMTESEGSVNFLGLGEISMGLSEPEEENIVAIH